MSKAPFLIIEDNEENKDAAQQQTWKYRLTSSLSRTDQRGFKGTQTHGSADSCPSGCCACASTRPPAGPPLASPSVFYVNNMNVQYTGET